MECGLAEWSAWAPGLEERQQWRRPPGEKRLREAMRGNGAPELSWMDSRKRRRCSTHSRIALHVAVDCCRQAGVDPADVPTVFATRHGELQLTVELLRTLSSGELLSPMTFANSVHNTPSGYFSIATDNMMPTRTVSAGTETFQHGFLDAAGMLGNGSPSPALLVSVNVAPPDPLDQFSPYDDVAYGTALLLTESNSGEVVELELNQEEASPENGLPPSVQFMAWYLGEQDPILHLPGSTSAQTWVFRRRDST